MTDTDAELRRLQAELDVARRQHAEFEKATRRLTRMYEARSQCSEAIVRSRSEQELFPAVCRAAVSSGGMAMAWIAVVDGGSQAVTAQASFGDEHGYLDGLQISIDASDAHGRGPTGTAIREDMPVWCDDFHADPRTAPWHERAARAGWASSASLPLHRDGRPVGALNLYSRTADAFDEDARTLALAMASDISLALDGFARVAARERAEQALRENEQLLSALVRHSPIYVFIKEVTPTESRVLKVSDNYVQMLGLESTAMAGKTMQQLFPAELAASMTADDWHVVSSGRVLSIEEEHAGHTYSTVKFPVTVGERHLLAGYTIDISERKAAEAENASLALQNRQLQKSESLGRMAGAVAHHFNNQLHALMMTLEVAMDEVRSRSGPFELLTEAWQAARRAAEVSTQMLAYVGHSQGKRELVDVSDACQRQLPMLLSCIPEGVGLETDFLPAGPAVRCNVSELQRVLTNLVHNAGEASADANGAVRVTVKAVRAAEIPTAHRFPVDWKPVDESYACVEVADSGSGIAAEEFENLFDPFFSTKFVGRGLGLPVALGIVRAHNGVLTVRSEPGKSSVFQAYFPATDEELPRKSSAGARAPVIAAGGTVLLVDDEAGVRRAVERALERAGFTVLTADDGIEAVELFRARQSEIDCVLCDVSMPRLNGWQTLTALRQLAPGFPVILASGYSEAQVMEGEHPELPSAFLSKPYQTELLIQTVSEVLANRHK